MCVDTVKLSVELDRDLPRANFEHVKSDLDIKTGAQRERWVLNGKDGDLSRPCEIRRPRLTYFPQDRRLISEVSLPKMLWGENIRCLSDGDIKIAFDRLDELHGEAVGGPLPSVGGWHVGRVDYCHPFAVGPHLKTYLRAISGMSLPAQYKPRIYPGETVEFQSQGRTVRFYNKNAETMGAAPVGMLRYEVESRGKAVSYLADKLSCEQVAREMLTEARSKDGLNWILEKLGFQKGMVIRGSMNIIGELCSRFGARTAQHLFWVLSNGVEGVERGYISKDSYHRAQRKLKAAGIVITDIEQDIELPALWVA